MQTIPSRLFPGERVPRKSVLGKLSWGSVLEESLRNSLLLGAVCSWEGSLRKGMLLGRASWERCAGNSLLRIVCFGDDVVSLGVELAPTGT